MSGEPAVLMPPEGDLPDQRRERLAALFDAHENRLYRLARRLSASADEANDLVQDTFVRAASALASVPTGFAKEEAWLVRVLINIQRDQWRRRAVRRRAASTLRADATACPATVESALAAKRAVWSALDRLQPRRRAIVVMHELEGMSPAAIAELVGVTVITVRWHLSMGRRDLKQILAPRMGDTT
jgi:RNA polymerase sigma-70 factor (ECF subfamily)